MQHEGRVESNTANGVGRIIFFHPKGNSMPGELLRKIAAEIERLGTEQSTKVIILGSEGEKVFCAGASFDEMKAVKDRSQAFEFFSGFARVILAIKRCPKFVIARVQARAAGGGVGIVAAADYALAAEAASVRLSELAIGIGPFIIGPAVLRKVGQAAFGEMAVSADWRDARWAHAKGLYAELYPNIQELDRGVDQFAQKLAAYSPEAMHKLKTVLWEGTESWEELLPARARITSELALGKFVQDTIAKM